MPVQVFAQCLYYFAPIIGEKNGQGITASSFEVRMMRLDGKDVDTMTLVKSGTEQPR
jgi:hypothetical protein